MPAKKRPAKKTSRSSKKPNQFAKLSRSLQKLPTKSIGLVVAGLVVGTVAGYWVWHDNGNDPRYEVANAAQIKAAKDAITADYKEDSSTKCSDPSDPISPADREAVFDKYLKVNKYANRAVIRGCGDHDSLLAKNPASGEWDATTINVSLDTRANPSWQIECLIDDITKADTVVRPENSSIDTGNLVGCALLKEQEQVADILSSSGAVKLSDLTPQFIQQYIKGGEEFFGY